MRERWLCVDKVKGVSVNKMSYTVFILEYKYHQQGMLWRQSLFQSFIVPALGT